MKRILQIFVLCFTALSINSQINVKIGYGTAFVNASTNDNILKEFNALKQSTLSDSLSIPFKGLSFLHGIELGLRFKFSENSGLEVNWQNLTRSRKAVGEIDNSTLFQQELFYSFNQLYLSYQSQFNTIGMGVGLGYNRVKIKDRIAGSDFKETVVNQNQLFAKVNLSFYFQSSSSVSFAIQPYIQIPLDDINLLPLRKELELSTVEKSVDPFKMIGISFIFYNGQQ